MSEMKLINFFKYLRLFQCVRKKKVRTWKCEHRQIESVAAVGAMFIK